MSSSSLRIALDVDEVLAGINAPWLDLYNRCAGTNYSVDDLTAWNFSSIGATTDEMMCLYDQLWNEEADRIACLVDSAMIRCLTDAAEVDLVTARTEATVDSLKRWLAAHRFPELNIVLNEPQISKAALNYDLYVDDAPHLAAEMSAHPEKILFLVSKPWNATCRTSSHPDGPANVHRVPRTDTALASVQAMLAATPPRRAA